MPAVSVSQVFELAYQHHESGRLIEAESLYRQVLALDPRNVDALHLLGVIAHQAGDNDAAERLIRQAIALHPNYPEAWSNLGNALCEQGQTAPGIAAYRQAIAIKPSFLAAYNNLGNALRNAGQLDAAIDACRQAIALDPSLPEPHNNLGTALCEKGQVDEAIAAFRQAIRLKPSYPEAHSNLGNALRDAGRQDESTAAYREAVALAPDDPAAGSALISSLHYHPNQNAGAIAAEQRAWSQRHAKVLEACVEPHRNEANPHRRLRIGYLSPDFGDHVVGLNILPLFSHHNHRDFEVICYAEIARQGRLTAALHQCAGKWHNVRGVNNQGLAEIVRRDGVDILVDLTQHTAGNRLPVFARRPAPVQVSFAGCPESTGVEAIGYRISDRRLEPESGDGISPIGDSGTGAVALQRPNERVYLIDTFWCYDPFGAEAKVNELPAEERGVVTFGSLNHFSKINDLVLKLWARVLRELQDSRLLLLTAFGSHRQRTIDFLAGEGVLAERVEFVEPCPRKDYLELYHRLDIALDPFPYGGHTTSLDALWMGVPVVSLAAEQPVSRAGLSILHNLGLPELVTFSQDEYVEIAVRLANDIPRLKELRRTLRFRMENSVLMDAPRFARQIEAAYRAMWREWCEKQDSSSQTVR